MFIDPNQRVAVSDAKGNTVYIKAKMDAGTRAAVQDEIRAKGLDSREDLELRGIGSYRLALLLHNVVGWEGPDFTGANGKPFACNRYWIQHWDTNEPIYQMVSDRIAELNEPAGSPDPNSVAPNGSTIDGEVSLPVAQ